MAVTLRDIAQKTGLSITTVSLVLNGRPCRVSEKTRDRIMQTAKEMNYLPNQLAVGLVNRQTNTIGLLVPDITNYFFSNLALGIDAEIHKQDKNILLINTEYDNERIKKGLNTLKSRAVEAVILTPASVLPQDISIYKEQIRDIGVPVVTVEYNYPDLECSCVQLNNRKGAYKAVYHLLELGHRRIACITGPEDFAVTRERLEGYLMAYRDFGMAEPEDFVFCGNYLAEGGYTAAGEILKIPEFTAVFAFNDVMALGAYRYLREHNVSVPDDISLVGFDNIDFSGLLAVPLTTVNQPAYEIGQEAARQALYEIENPGAEKKTITFEPQLILRESTRPV